VEHQGRAPGTQGWVVFLLVIALGLLVMIGVIFVELSQRRIPGQYAKRMVARRMFSGTTTYIPIKVNQAGVIPVISASSLLYLPAPYTQFRPGDKFSSWISTNFLKGDHPIYILTFFLLIVFFAYFYVAITFNPNEVVDNMKKYKVGARLLKRSEIDGRSDDNEDTIRVRLQVYAEQTEPLLKVNRSRGLLVEVDGLGEIDEVSERVFAALEAHREGKASELIEP